MARWTPRGPSSLFEPPWNLIQFAFGLDGGGSVAGDDSGNVYVLWHAGGPEAKGENDRRVWLAHSMDESKTFAREKAAYAKSTGACGCCGLKAFVGSKGAVYVLYRSATERVDRDTYLLTSTDKGVNFAGEDIHPWKVGICPMSSYAFTESGNDVLAAWETEGQVYYSRIDQGTGKRSEPIAPAGVANGRKHPVLACNAQGETILVWAAVNGALRQARRGLPGPTSLADLLAQHRGVRNIGDLPPLTARQVLDWADGFHAHTGRWPTENAEPQEIPGSGGETWRLLIVAMRKGNRGFSPGMSLAELLSQHRSVRNILALSPLTTDRILEWADAFHAKTGEWPTRGCSPQEIPGTDGEQWCNVDQAMRKGLRGLPRGSSLAALLSERRGVRNSNLLPQLTLPQVLRWADDFFEKSGEWPTVRHSPQLVEGTDGERWRNVDNALRYGLRGLPGNSSQAKLLARHRGIPNTRAPMNRRMAAR